MGAAFRSEWIKFRSLRSLAGLGITVAVVTLAITYLHCRGYHLVPGDNPAAIHVFGVTLGMFFGIAGTLVAASEHASGTITATIAAIPRRGRVAGAKAALIACSGSREAPRSPWPASCSGRPRSRPPRCVNRWAALAHCASSWAAA